MAAEHCLFCRIVDHSLPADFIYEAGSIVGIRDIHPQAPVHYLFLPKNHIGGIDEITPDTESLVGELVCAANHVARQAKIDKKGYRLVINCKAEGGQTVNHLHLHLLGGRPMTWPPG